MTILPPPGRHLLSEFLDDDIVQDFHRPTLIPGVCADPWGAHRHYYEGEVAAHNFHVAICIKQHTSTKFRFGEPQVWQMLTQPPNHTPCRDCGADAIEEYCDPCATWYIDAPNHKNWRKEY